MSTCVEIESDISSYDVSPDHVLLLDPEGKFQTERKVDLLAEAGYSTEIASLPDPPKSPKDVSSEIILKSEIVSLQQNNLTIERTTHGICRNMDMYEDFDNGDLPFKIMPEVHNAEIMLNCVKTKIELSNSSCDNESNFHINSASHITDNLNHEIRSSPVSVEGKTPEKLDHKLHEQAIISVDFHDVFDDCSAKSSGSNINSATEICNLEEDTANCSQIKDENSGNSDINMISSTPKDCVVLLESDGTVHSEHQVDLLKEVGYTEDIGILPSELRRKQNEYQVSEYERIVGKIDSDKTEIEQNSGCKFDEFELQSKEREINNLNDSDDSTLLQNFFVMDGLPFDVDNETHSTTHGAMESNESSLSKPLDAIENVVEQRNALDGLSEQPGQEADQSNSSSNNNDKPQNDPCSSNGSSLCDSVFSSIPYELTQHIFSYLSLKELCLNVALVCRKWNEYANDPVHWTRLSIGCTHPVTSYMLAQIIQKSPFLRVLSLHGKFDLTADELLFIARNCPLLRELDLGFVVTVDPEGIFNIAQYCMNLEVLNIEGCVLVDNLCICYMCKPGCLKNLRSLNLSHCTALTDMALNLVAKNKDKVTSLNVDGIPWISDQSLSGLCANSGARLKQLWLDGAEISDDGIQSISQYCNQLTLLSLSFAELLTDTSLRYLKTMTTLVNLTLRKGQSFTEHALQDLFLSSSLKNLQKLDLSECTQLSDEGVAALADCCGSSLTHLALCWCWFVLDQGILHIVDKCRKLRFLDLTGLDKITGQCFTCIPTQLPELSFLDLKQCNKIDDDIILDTIKSTPRLITVIDYYGNEFNVQDS